MRLLHHFPLLSHMFLLVSILAACLAQDAMLLLLLAGGFAAASWLVTEGPRGVFLTRRWSLILSAAVAIWAVVLISSDLDNPVVGLAQFAIWIAVIKLYEKRSLEIEAERLIMAVLLMVLASMDAFDLLFGVLLAVWMVIGIVVILLFQLHYGVELGASQHGHGLDEGGEDPAIGTRVHVHMRRVLVFVLVAIGLGSSVLFVAFPRGLTEELSVAASSRLAMLGGGQDSDITLVSGTRIVESVGVVGEVTVIDEREGDHEPLKRLYLRTGTASMYLGAGRWTPQPYGQARMQSVDSTWKDIEHGEGTPGWTMRIELSEPLEYLPIPAGTVAVRSSIPLWLKVFSEREVIEIGRMNIGVVHVRSTGVVLAASVGEPTTGVVSAAANEVAQRVLQDRGISVTEPRDEAARSQWRSRVANALLAHLQSSRFTYTLDLSRIGRDTEVRHMDPIERFLLAEPQGHCEYFAAAFVSMAQSLGLDARIVMGFMCQPESAEGLQFVIQDRDAHAWAEVRVHEDRWTQFDPTVIRRVDRAASDTGLLATLQGWYQHAEAWWRLNVLGFDAHIQSELAADTLPGPASFFEQARLWVISMARQVNFVFGIGRGGTIYIVSAAVFIFATVLLLVRGNRTRRRFRIKIGLRPGRPSRELGQCIAVYRELLVILKRAGFEKPPHVSPLAWCGRMSQSNPDAAELADRVVHAFYAVRYGGEHIDEDGRRQAREWLSQLRAILKVPA